MTRYDIAIIGTGPAGLEAAITAKVRNKNILLLGGKLLSDKVNKAHTIQNYLGLPEVSGEEMQKAFQRHLEQMQVKITEDKVNAVYAMGKYFAIQGHQAMYEADTVILACGMSTAKPFPGELENLGRGVSYCATCDGAFFRGKDVAVIGGGNTALQDAEFLSNYCNKVYVVHRRDEFRGESNLVDVLKEKDNVEFVLDSIVKDIEGKFMVERLFLRNKKTGEDFHIPVSGVFVAIGQIPQNEIFDGLVRLDENGFILASEDCMTSHPGIFAAGDCRTKEVRQLTTAAADGSVAALAACKYLSMNF